MYFNTICIYTHTANFPGCTVVKNLPPKAEYTGWIPGLGRFHMPWNN